jgi:hypothetical protein
MNTASSPMKNSSTARGIQKFIRAPLRCAQAYGVRRSFFLRFYGTAEAVP